ncbi:hypothetical protein FHR71_001202 [Methylobacterium sp. RAS18]|nr:hypothetical protein [Methylobacterium sp. RAS18]
MRIVEHHEGRVPGPGLYQMPATVYHADPAPGPSLSSSIARALLSETPRHAHAKHPRLTPQTEDSKNRKMDLGSVAHEILTGEGRGIHVVSARNKAGETVETYASKAAQEERDEALAAGLTPVLYCDLLKAERMVEAVRSRLAETPETRGAFEQGAGETSLVWQDRLGLWGRAQLDWRGPEPHLIWDLKTTSAGLSDRAIATKIAEGLDIQEHWYRRGLTRLVPDLMGRVRMRFVFVETVEPFECRVIELSGEQQWLGERKAITAAVLFRECLRTGRWPGYAPGISRVEAPAWPAAQWEAREASDPLFREFGTALVLAHSTAAPDQEIAA